MKLVEDALNRAPSHLLCLDLFLNYFIQLLFK